MKIVVRVDGGATIGGGHIMRCLTLAETARARGHLVTFVCVRDDVISYVRAKGFDIIELQPLDFTPESSPAHAIWLRLPWDIDAARTAEVLKNWGANWLIWDHYGLDARWVAAVKARASVRVLAIDDLDDRDLGADLVLDQTRLKGRRAFSGGATLTGPSFALLRPEFRNLRAKALTRRNGDVQRIIITPGLMDAAGLAPLSLDALNAWEGEVEVVMGHASQSRAAVEERIKGRKGWQLTLDATDMPERLAAADLCIGAAGMSTWERCCVGLPAFVVAVAENQMPVCQAIEERGAAVCLPLTDARDPDRFKAAIHTAMAKTKAIADAAAQLCDGKGADRVLDCLEADLRPLTRNDARQIFDWRTSNRVRKASLDQTEFSFDSHLAWMDRILDSTDGLWRIYAEPKPIGLVSAVDQGEGVWLWSFYLGADDPPKGAGGRMLSRFLDEIWHNTSCEQVMGVVLKDNIVSQALHRKLGFRQIASADEHQLAFVLDRPAGK